VINKSFLGNSGEAQVAA